MYLYPVALLSLTMFVFISRRSRSTKPRQSMHAKYALDRLYMHSWIVTHDKIARFCNVAFEQYRSHIGSRIKVIILSIQSYDSVLSHNYHPIHVRVHAHVHII